MATWSTDGELNTLDNLVQPIAPGTTSVSNKIDGAAPTGKLITKNAQIVVNDGTTDRVTMGQRTDGTYGIKVSKAGKDSTTGANSDMVMNSDFNQFKIMGTGTSTMTVSYVSPGASPNPYVAGLTVPHGLGYAPAFLAFITPPVSLGFVGYFTVPWDVVFWDNSIGRLYPAIKVDASSDSTNFYASINVDRGAFNGVWTVKYYILQETAN